MTEPTNHPSDDLVSRTIKERSSIYGPPVESFNNIGLAFTAILQQHYGLTFDHPIPGWLASLMLAQFKNQRAARVFHADNYVDGHAYLRFAEEGQRALAEAEGKKASDSAIYQNAGQQIVTDLERISRGCLTSDPTAPAGLSKYKTGDMISLKGNATPKYVIQEVNNNGFVITVGGTKTFYRFHEAEELLTHYPR